MKRNQALDFFRGIMLILITVDHFLSDQDMVKFFTYEFIGWVTAAEGFVFLSGLTAGLVYTRKMTERGDYFVKEAVRNRAWLIYRNHIAILLFALAVVLLGYPVNEYWIKDYGLFLEKPFISAMLGAMLLYQPIYLDILPMYTVFILFVPVVIKYFRKQYLLPLSLISFAIYLIPLFNQEDYLNNLVEIRDVNTGFFNLLSWQFIFFLGLLSGFISHRENGIKLLRNKRLALLAGAICIGLFITKRANLDLHEVEYLFAKDALGPVRLLNGLAIIFLVAFVASQNANFFKAKVICYLGRHSLEVYSFHVVLIIIFKPVRETLSDMFSVQMTNQLFIYPWVLALTFLVLVPALYLAPILLKKKIYVFDKGQFVLASKEIKLVNTNALSKAG